MLSLYLIFRIVAIILPFLTQFSIEVEKCENKVKKVTILNDQIFEKISSHMNSID